jgi:hypothetical protein
MKLVAALAAAVAATPVAGTAYPSASLTRLDAQLLALHNGERARVGAPALRWDPSLAAAAASYGPVLDRLGRLEHSPRASRPGQRENLWYGTRGAFGPNDMVGSWIAERAYFRPGVFPNVSSTGNWLDVSHYTQLIWRTTTHVGCAVHRGARYDFLICRYSPPGNRDGTPLT